jgi:hypothetical protein
MNLDNAAVNSVPRSLSAKTKEDRRRGGQFGSHGSRLSTTANVQWSEKCFYFIPLLACLALI